MENPAIPNVSRADHPKCQPTVQPSVRWWDCCGFPIPGVRSAIAPCRHTPYVFQQVRHSAGDPAAARCFHVLISLQHQLIVQRRTMGRGAAAIPRPVVGHCVSPVAFPP